LHRDLATKNVLFNQSGEIKVCDFGSSMHVSEILATPYLQPRYYRAPEVILGQKYDTQIDIWSAGVTLFELGTGKILFAAKSNNGMLGQFLDVCGAVSRRMATNGNYSTKHFNPEGDYLFRDVDSMTGLPELMAMRKFAKPVRPLQGMLDRVLKEPPPNADTKTQERLLPRLGELLSRCLRVDPAERATPEQALAQPFHKK